MMSILYDVILHYDINALHFDFIILLHYAYGFIMLHYDVTVLCHYLITLC